MNLEPGDGPILLTAEDLGKLRLVLSTYQDGTGMLAASDGKTLPGWRDFERAVAAVFTGESQESKYVFDIFPLMLPDPHALHWHFPTANRLCGNDNEGTIFEWYGESGGQLKYYPLAHTATWTSNIFQLEQLPSEDEIQYGILARTQKYFPRQWAEACKSYL